MELQAHSEQEVNNILFPQDNLKTALKDVAAASNASFSTHATLARNMRNEAGFIRQ